MAALDLSGILLPVENCHRVLDFLLLLPGLRHLSLKLFLGVQLPQLGVHLLLHHLLLNVSSLVDELLLTLDGGTIIVKLGIFFSQSIVFGLEFHVLTSLDFISSLLLTL